ncbi:MAG TPA: N-acetylmuramoyl-L-alanine amidase [Nannocystaceae bacterium]|nr:N-acetylmuramoyl-L-alanine amidase [Nannocystaceae bacterium]
MATVVLDPGHGGTANLVGSTANNAVGPAGTLEKNLTLDVALRVQPILVGFGHSVLLTRTTDVNVSAADRIAVASAMPAEVFLSIHFNGFRDPGVQGTETLVRPVGGAVDPQSNALATDIQAELVATLGHRDRGLVPGGWAVLSDTLHNAMTARCLAEVSFLTDPAEETRLADPAYLDRIANALAHAVSNHLSVRFGRVRARVAGYRDGVRSITPYGITAEPPPRTTGPWLPGPSGITASPTGLGRVFACIERMLAPACLDRAAYEAIVAARFDPSAASCTDTPRMPCRYNALVIGEWTHDGTGEQDVALHVIDSLVSRFPNGSFALRDEHSSGGAGMLGAGHVNELARLVRAHSIDHVTLAEDQQYQADQWVPALLANAGCFISYTGSAHTSSLYLERMRELMPAAYSGDPGPGIADCVRRRGRAALALQLHDADAWLGSVERQAYEESLETLPDPADFRIWTIAFASAWRSLTAGIAGTCIRPLSDDVHWGLVGNYAGMEAADFIAAAYAGAHPMLARNGRWRLWNWNGREVRFRRTDVDYDSFVFITVDANGDAGTPSIRDFR